MQDIFSISLEKDFEECCLQIFKYQYENVEVYQKFVDFLKVNPDEVKEILQIPFLPIEMFKSHRILDKNKSAELYFQSSGTTQVNLSKHWVSNPELYQKSIEESFKKFIGNAEEFVFLGLLPNYLERQNSSLVYMVSYLMKLSGKVENGYFLYDHIELLAVLRDLAQKKTKVILFGVSFALLDFLDTLVEQGEQMPNNKNLIVMETGGMKGRKEEMIKDELLKILQDGLKTERIYSEYSMTELLSQAYSFGDNEYLCPNWMRILIRNTEDPLSYVSEGRTGAINIIDLVNIHSCSFIATQDLGKIKNGYFQVLGRIDHSDIRGCSLLVS